MFFILIAILVLNTLFDYSTIWHRCRGMPAYERHSRGEKVVRVLASALIPFLLMVIFPDYGSWKGNAIEYNENLFAFIMVLLLALAIGPTLAYAWFRNFKVALLGFGLRALLLISILVMGLKSFAPATKGSLGRSIHTAASFTAKDIDSDSSAESGRRSSWSLRYAHALKLRIDMDPAG